ALQTRAGCRPGRHGTRADGRRRPLARALDLHERAVGHSRPRRRRSAHHRRPRNGDLPRTPRALARQPRDRRQGFVSRIMGRPDSRRATFLTAAFFCALAGGLSIAPPAWQHALRGTVLDVVVSGQAFAVDRLDRWRAAEVAVSTAPPAEQTRVVAK